MASGAERMGRVSDLSGLVRTGDLFMTFLSGAGLVDAVFLPEVNSFWILAGCASGLGGF